MTIVALVDRPGWQTRGACRGMNPELWFPEGEGREWVGEIAVAQEICDSCPVRVECLNYALTEPSMDGIWGGTTIRDRERIRRHRRRTP